MSINKINNAISILNDAIKMNDDLFQAHSLMGKIFLDLTKYNNAINYLKKSVDINPKNAIDLNNLGFCYYKMEKINQSKEFYLKAIKANPLFAKAYSNLGLVHQTEGNLEEAVNYYIKCLEINPNDYEAFRLLSMSKKLNLNDKYVKEMVKIKSSDISKENKILISSSGQKISYKNHFNSKQGDINCNDKALTSSILQKNNINVPAAILQEPFITLNLKGLEYNLAHIGFTIAHELSHSLDDFGSKYNKYGELEDWWTEKDKKEFKKIQENIVKQYETYALYDGIKFDAWPSIGEDLADISGFAICVEYLRDFQQKNKDILPIQSLSFEIFFVYFALQSRQKI